MSEPKVRGIPELLSGATSSHDILSLLRNEDFSFSMRGWKGNVESFFRGSPEQDEILEERRRFLVENAGLYCGVLPEAADCVSEFVALASRQFISADLADFPNECALNNPTTQTLWLGSGLEPDFMLLIPSDDGVLRTVAGVVCFPSNWDFSEALGKKLHEIHGVVPGLNESVGDKIHALLQKLAPGDSWSRLNWGLSSSPERNQHPSRQIPRLLDSGGENSAWLRVELQVLHKLPRTSAILFGIRPVSISLEEVAGIPEAAAALKRQVETMPTDMRIYKGIGEDAGILNSWLG